MTKGIPKKRQRAEQLRKKRAQAAPVLATGAKKPVAAVPIASRPQARSVAAHEPLPAHSYPAKRVSLGKPQTAGGPLMRWKPSPSQLSLVIDCANARTSVGSAAALLGISPAAQGRPGGLGA
jgi:hypothetical protein